ncbi:shikimate kinase [soil metagenome]
MVGLMGSGKTTTGRVLAARLGWPYLDNDVDLIRDTGKSAAELAESGARTLHELESSRLFGLVAETPPFVAGVAASVADRLNDLELIRSSGLVVYLRATPETLASRVERDDVTRPWVKGGAVEVLTSMLDARGGVFTSIADVVVDVDERSPHEAVGDILAALQLSPASPST